MQGIFARWVVAVGAGLALMVGQGCRRRAAPAPVQPVVLSAPRVQLDFPLGPLPVEDDVDSVAIPRVNPTALRQEPVQPVQVQPADAQAPATVEETQRLQDARLLQEQQAASERQQQELNQEIEQDLKTQEEMEAEPRIQDIPEVPLEPVVPEMTQRQ